MKTQWFIPTLAATAILSIGSVQAATMVPAEITFGSDNDGNGGFTTSTEGSNSGTWAVQTEALRYTAGSSLANARALQEFTLDTTPGETYDVSLVTTVVDNGQGNANRFGVLLFATGATSTSSGIMVSFSYNNYDNPSSRALIIRTGGINTSDGSAASVPWTGLGGDAAIGVTYTISGTIAYVGTDIDLDFQVTDGTTTSATVSRTVTAASFTGNFFGIGSRSQGLGDARGPATFDYKSFSIVPEPASLALLALGGMMVLGRRRA